MMMNSGLKEDGKVRGKGRGGKMGFLNDVENMMHMILCRSSIM